MPDQRANFDSRANRNGSPTSVLTIASGAPFDESDKVAWGTLAAYAEDVLRVQPQIVELQNQLLNMPSFGGLWVSRDGSITVAATDGRISDLIDQSLVEFLQPNVVVSAHTYSELTFALSSAAAIAEREKLDISLGIDVVANHVYVISGDAAWEQLKRSLASNDADLIVRDSTAVSSEPTTTLRGGFTADSCTSGFAVTDGAGSRGMLRAGHCAGSYNTTFSQQGVTMSVVNQMEYGDVDREIGVIPAGHTNDNILRLSSPYPNDTRPMLNYFSNSSYYVGMPVQKEGRISGYTYGTINELCNHPGYIPYGSGSVCFLKSGSGILSIPGDSGGPSFQNNTAVGTTTGCSSNSPTGCGGGYVYGYYFDAVVARIASQTNGTPYYLYSGTGK